MDWCFAASVKTNCQIEGWDDEFDRLSDANTSALNGAVVIMTI